MHIGDLLFFNCLSGCGAALADVVIRCGSVLSSSSSLRMYREPLKKCTVAAGIGLLCYGNACILQTK
jgi:hypothetical protein